MSGLYCFQLAGSGKDTAKASAYKRRCGSKTGIRHDRNGRRLLCIKQCGTYRQATRRFSQTDCLIPDSPEKTESVHFVQANVTTLMRIPSIPESAFAQASTVAPVVNTSSTITTCFPLSFSASGVRANRPAAFAQRS